jgi:hypothetical protein
MSVTIYVPIHYYHGSQSKFNGLEAFFVVETSLATQEHESRCKSKVVEVY